MELKKMFYLSNVAIAVNMSQPSVRIGGGLHALIHIMFLQRGFKSSKPNWDLNLRTSEGEIAESVNEINFIV